MLRTEDHPTGHEPPTRRGAGPRRWLLVGAAAVAVVAVGVTLVVDDDEQVETATPPTIPARDILEVHDDPEIEPGRYFIDPDGDPSTSLQVFYEVADEGWSPWAGALKFNDTAHTALTITTVDNVVVHGCTDHSPAEPPVGPSVEDLANALAALEPFEVTAAPSAVTAFGYEGIHLQLTVPDLEIAPRGGDLEYADCMNGVLVSWINDHYLGGPFRGYDTDAGPNRGLLDPRRGGPATRDRDQRRAVLARRRHRRARRHLRLDPDPAMTSDNEQADGT